MLKGFDRLNYIFCDALIGTLCIFALLCVQDQWFKIGLYLACNSKINCSFQLFTYLFTYLYP